MAQSDKQKKKTDSVLAQRYWRDALQQLQGRTRAKADDLSAGLMWLVEAYSKEPTLDAAKEDLYEIRFGAILAQHPKLRQLWPHAGLAAVAASRNGRFVVTASNQVDRHELVLWDAQGGQRLHSLTTNHEINGVEFSGDSRYLLAATGKKDDARGELCIWYWPQANELPQLVGNKPLTDAGAVLAAAFLRSPDASTPPRVVAVIQGPDATNKVRLWRSLDELPRDLTIEEPDVPQASALSALTVSPDGRFVATWGARGNVHVWSVKNQAGIGDLKIQIAAVAHAVFSSNGNWLATVDRRGGAQLWDTSSGACLKEWAAHGGAATYVAFSPDDRRLVTDGEDNATRLWEIVTQSDEGVGAEIRVQPKFEFPHESGLVRAKFSPDGRHLATNGRDGTVRVWDVATGRPVAPTLHHAFAVSAIEFSHDGFRILTQIATRLRCGNWLPRTRRPPRCGLVRG